MARVRKPTFRRVTLKFIYSYSVFVAALWLFADQFVLFPTRTPLDVSGLQRIEVRGPDGCIEVWTARSAAAMRGEPAAFVIEFIGSGSRAEAYARFASDEWRDFPVEVWAVNYPGYGGSAGSAKLKKLAPAALAVFDTVRTRAPGCPIFLSAQSLGTCPALYVAAHRPVAGLLLLNPPPLSKVILGEFGWWNAGLCVWPIAWTLPDEMDSVSNAAACRAPAVFIQSQEDNLVPVSYQQSVINAFGGPRRMMRIPGAGHIWHVTPDHRDQLNAALQWLVRGRLTPVRQDVASLESSSTIH